MLLFGGGYGGCPPHCRNRFRVVLRLGWLALNRTFNPAVIIIEVVIVLFILWTLYGNKASRHFFEVR